MPAVISPCELRSPRYLRPLSGRNIPPAAGRLIPALIKDQQMNKIQQVLDEVRNHPYSPYQKHLIEHLSQAEIGYTRISIS